MKVLDKKTTPKSPKGDFLSYQGTPSGAKGVLELLKNLCLQGLNLDFYHKLVLVGYH